MRTNVFVLTVTVTAMFAWSLTARASLAHDRAFEDKLAGELRARDPEAAAIFARANAARDAHDTATAASLYGQVHDRAPWFTHATRRQCMEEEKLGHTGAAVALCREAVDTDPLPLNKSALALLLTSSAERDPGQAETLAREAQTEAPDDEAVETVVCEVALSLREAALLTTCVSALRRLAPGDVTTHYFAAVDAARHERLDDAEAELQKAHALGLPEAVYRPLDDAIEGSRSPLERYGWPALRVLALWLAAFAVLYGLGRALSAATLRAISRGSFSSGHARGIEGLLRRAYRATLALTCAYFYLSMPLVALSVVGAFGVLVYVCFAAGQIPVKLVLLAGVAIAVTLSSMAKGIFARRRDEEPGQKLDLASEPKLRAVLDEVAAKIETRPVDSVYVTPGTEIAVFERGGMLGPVQGKNERCLVLGAAVLSGLPVAQFKAILAHEYGHFRNEDTAGGGFALRVRRSVSTMAIHLIQGRAATIFNPAWWFVRGFHATFLRVSQGASRLQEALADRWAANAYGSDAFSCGLRHVVETTVRFDLHLSATLKEVVPEKRPVANLYVYEPQERGDPEKVNEAIEKAMSGPSSPYDSHPKPAVRIAWVAKLAAPAPEAAPDGESVDAWSLLSARESIQTSMTATLRGILARRGIRLVEP